MRREYHYQFAPALEARFRRRERRALARDLGIVLCLALLVSAAFALGLLAPI